MSMIALCFIYISTQINANFSWMWVADTETANWSPRALSQSLRM